MKFPHSIDKISADSNYLEIFVFLLIHSFNQSINQVISNQHDPENTDSVDQ